MVPWMIDEKMTWVLVLVLILVTYAMLGKTLNP